MAGARHPAEPGAWLTQAARHNALDRLRRETRATATSSRCSPSRVAAAGRRRSAEADERLPLLFGCCHPALSPDAQLALTLRAVCGLTTAQIARATLQPEADDRRSGSSRAKRKIGAAGIPLRVPEGGGAAPSGSTSC